MRLLLRWAGGTGKPAHQREDLWHRILSQSFCQALDSGASDAGLIEAPDAAATIMLAVWRAARLAREVLAGNHNNSACLDLYPIRRATL